MYQFVWKWVDVCGWIRDCAFLYDFVPQTERRICGLVFLLHRAFAERVGWEGDGNEQPYRAMICDCRRRRTWMRKRMFWTQVLGSLTLLSNAEANPSNSIWVCLILLVGRSAFGWRPSTMFIIYIGLRMPRITPIRSFTVCICICVRVDSCFNPSHVSAAKSLPRQPMGCMIRMSKPHESKQRCAELQESLNRNCCLRQVALGLCGTYIYIYISVSPVTVCACNTSSLSGRVKRSCLSE